MENGTRRRILLRRAAALSANYGIEEKELSWIRLAQQALGRTLFFLSAVVEPGGA
jgi:hypothetical protein